MQRDATSRTTRRQRSRSQQALWRRAERERNLPAEQDAPSRTRSRATLRQKGRHEYTIPIAGTSRKGARRASSTHRKATRGRTKRVIQISTDARRTTPARSASRASARPRHCGGLAQKILKATCLQAPLDKGVYLMDLTALVAGTQFRGQFESRMKTGNRGRYANSAASLSLTRVHREICGRRRRCRRLDERSEHLTRASTRQRIQVISATTFAEYRKYIKEKGLCARARFQPVLSSWRSRPLTSPSPSCAAFRTITRRSTAWSFRRRSRGRPSFSQNAFITDRFPAG